MCWKAIRAGKYRQGWAAKLLGNVPTRTSPAPCVWLHAVSLGEVNLLKPILDQLQKSLPGWDFVISTTTKTGYDLACRRFAEHIVFYCPFDFSWSVNRTLRRIRPTLLVLAELELWPNLITLARQNGARVAVLNGRLSDRSFRGYMRLRRLLRPVWRRLDLVLAQNHEYADRFAALGAPQVIVTGSIKFDGVQTDRGNSQTRQLANLAGIAPTDTVFLAGSTQHPEEQFALDTFRALSKKHPALRLILVPRHPERFDDVARLLDGSELPWQRRTLLRAGAPMNDAAPARILLVDTTGELGAWWGTAHIAFVGGSMGSRGGQNMLEPAAYGAAVSFGPNTRNFRDIVALLVQAEAALVVSDADELTDFVARCCDDASYARTLGDRARAFVISQQGAAQTSVEHLARLADLARRQQSTPIAPPHHRGSRSESHQHTTAKNRKKHA